MKIPQAGITAIKKATRQPNIGLASGLEMGLAGGLQTGSQSAKKKTTLPFQVTWSGD
jgi:hypothetical protein